MTRMHGAFFATAEHLVDFMALWRSGLSATLPQNQNPKDPPKKLSFSVRYRRLNAFSNVTQDYSHHCTDFLLCTRVQHDTFFVVAWHLVLLARVQQMLSSHVLQ